MFSPNLAIFGLSLCITCMREGEEVSDSGVAAWRRGVKWCHCCSLFRRHFTLPNTKGPNPPAKKILLSRLSSPKKVA